MYDGDGGWGLVNNDGTLRLSGWSASRWLHSRKSETLETEKWQNCLRIGIIVEEAAIITLTIVVILIYKKMKALQKLATQNDYKTRDFR